MAFSYEIEQPLGILSGSEDGRYTVEVNMISYNGARPKLDIRKWDREKNRMQKGIVLTWEETQKLLEVIQDLTGADFR